MRKVQVKCTEIPVIVSDNGTKDSTVPSHSYTSHSSANRKKAEDYVKYLPVLVTGARNGEIVIGTKTQSKDAMIKIHGGDVVPWKRELDHIRSFEGLWNKFLQKLGSIDFFGEMELSSREAWLEEHQNTSKVYMDEFPDVKFEVLRLGKSDMLTKLSEEDVDRLLSGEIILGSEVRAMFPRKPGSKAKRVTLMFRRGIWKVASTHRETSSFDGPLFDVSTGLVNRDGETSSKDEVILVLERFGLDKDTHQNVGFLVQKRGINVDEETVMSYVLDMYPKFSLEDVDTIKQACYTFTPASYKSLLQKIIRFRPKTVDLGDVMNHPTDSRVYPSDFVLCVTFALLVSMPGSFVPDIQRYVTGMESVFKRLVVSIFEDSSVKEEDYSSLIRMLCGAILSQRVKSWRPTEEMIRTALELSRKTVLRSKAYYYDISKGIELPKYYVDADNFPLENCSALIDELRSFNSDLGMIRDIAKSYSPDEGYSYGECEHSFDSNDVQPKVMPLRHCVDQHWAPEIVYFYPYKTVQHLHTPGSRPYSQLVRDIFGITGVNPRRNEGKKGRVMNPKTYSDKLEDKAFTKETRQAQKLLLMSRQSTKDLVFSPRTTLYKSEYNIDDSWLAGLVGTMEVYGRPVALATLDPRDISNIILFRKPSREMKSATLTEKQHDNAMSKVLKMFKDGVKLKGSRPPLDILIGSTLTLGDDGLYHITTKDKKTRVGWNDLTKGSKSFHTFDIDEDLLEDNLYKVNDLSFTETILTANQEGVMWNSNNVLDNVLKEYPIEVVRRLLFYITKNASSIEFPHISREGGGSKDAVMIEDVGAYQLLLKISLIYPSAISRREHKTLIFDVKFPPLLWEINHKVKEFVSGVMGTSEPNESGEWSDMSDKLQRDLFWYQEEGLKRMREEHIDGITSHFVYMTVGAGKTLTTLTFAKWLKSVDALPKYILYSLPSSAFKSVIAEIEAFGLDINIIVPLKRIPNKYSGNLRSYASLGCEMHPFKVNMIEHDHLRECGDTLSKYMTDSVFIFDEAHKALNDSIRTSVALNLSSLSRTTVTLTGTPIIDTKTYKLIRWLERIVKFEVNESNYWVATGAMIKYIVNTNVPIIEKSIRAEFTPKEKKEYISLVPPGLGGTNTNHHHKDILEATKLCYNSSTREMINQSVEYLKNGHKIFVIAKTADHALSIKEGILNHSYSIDEEDVFIIGKGQSLLLTQESVSKGKVHDYKVVITTIRHSEGYTLTTLDTMITSVYPSNNATREQLRGRINRPGQYAKQLIYLTVHTGILTYILEHHNDAKNMSSVLKSISEQIYV